MLKYDDITAIYLVKIKMWDIISVFYCSSVDVGYRIF